MGHGIVDVMPDANWQSAGFMTAAGLDTWAVVNIYGGAIHCPPTIPTYDTNVGAWAWLGRGGQTYWNQYDGDVFFPTMNYWGEDGEMYINVSGGSFWAGYKPVPKKGKVYINVSGTGTVTINGAWKEFFYPMLGGGTWFTLNGGGTLRLRNWGTNDWTTNPTVGGLLTSDSNIIAEYENGDPNAAFTVFTTDACGDTPDADMDKDCDVDFEDYASFTQGW